MSPSPQPYYVRFFATPDELHDWFDADHETAEVGPMRWSRDT